MDTENAKNTNKSEIEKFTGKTRIQWTFAVLVNLAPFTYGLQLGWVSPMTKVLQSNESPAGRPLTEAEISMIAGIPCLAAVIGIFMLLYVVDNLGRRTACLIIAVFQLLCWIIKICPANYASLLVARISCGLGAGGCFHVIPMYVKELSQDNIRGTLVSMTTLLQNMGILTMYCIGNYLDYYVVLYLVVGLPLLNIIVLMKAPESPSFLVKKGKSEEAAETVAFLRCLTANDKEVLNEIDSIKKEDDYFNSMPNITFFSIFKEKAWRRGFFIMLMIFISHGLNGVFYITNYASNILAESKVNISPELQTLAVPIFLMTGTLFTMTFVDRLGRKLLLAAAFLISTLTFSGLASTMLLNIYGFTLSGWLSVVIIVVTICCYGAGVSPVPYIVGNEMFNFQVRAKLMACLSALAWFVSFFQIIIFSAITTNLGGYATFYIFGAINLFGAFVTIIILPETGGKSEATKIVAFLRGLEVTDKEVVNEIVSIRTENDYFNSIPNVTFFKIFKDKAWRRGFLIMFMAFTCLGLNGVFFIANYAATLLAYSNVQISPEIQTLAVPVFIMVGSLITMALVDRVGRKSLKASAYIISGLAFFGLASSMLLNIHGYFLSGLVFVVGIILTIFCYGYGILPVPYIIASELFNFQVRAKLMACLSAYSWFVSFLQIIIFSAITSHLGAYVSFFMFGAINLLGAVITITLLPETGGKSVSEIEEELRKGIL